MEKDFNREQKNKEFADAIRAIFQSLIDEEEAYVEDYCEEYDKEN